MATPSHATYLLTICLLLSITPPATSSATPPPIPPPRVLIIGERTLNETHKQILSILKDSTIHVTQLPPETPTIPLQSSGEYLYDAIIFLSPSATIALPVQKVKSFLRAGNTIFLTASTTPSAYTTTLAAAIGLDLLQKPLIDHITAFRPLDDGTHTYIRAGATVPSERLLGSAVLTKGDIVFNGPAATLLKDNELVRPIIWGSPSCYVKDPHTGAPRVAGSAAILAAAISTRTGGRAAYFGSLSAMSDVAFATAGERHRIAVSSFLAWTLGSRGMLHVGKINHWGLASGRADPEYRVGDRVAVSLDVMEWLMEGKKWVPFRADDMQVELTMLNPYVRTRFRDLGNGTFATTVSAPSQIGVYKFVVEYNRPGVSQILELEVVPVRPLLHNEYERFIAMATPYYFASFSMLVAVCLLGIVLIFGSYQISQVHDKED